MSANLLYLAGSCCFAVGTLINVFLILGGDKPILVDAGVRNAEVLTRLGIQPTITEEHSLHSRLAEHGVRVEDIAMVAMTHLHVDHAGLLDTFPMSTPVVVNRRELGAAFSGLQGLLYAPEDLHHVLDRTYTPGALRILDLEMSGPETLAPGIRVQASGGHTDGSLMVLVDTDEGVACLCGDVLYGFEGSVLEQLNQTNLHEPQTSNNFTSSMVQEKAAIKRVLNAGALRAPTPLVLGRGRRERADRRSRRGEHPRPSAPHRARGRARGRGALTGRTVLVRSSNGRRRARPSPGPAASGSPV